MIRVKEKGWLFKKVYDKINSKIRIVFVLLLLFLGLSLAKNVSKIVASRNIIRQKELSVEKLRRENEEIKKRLEEVSTETYIEKQLRDSLGLAKEGEVIIVLPDKEVLRSLAPRIEEEEATLPDPNWKKWLYLFFR